uniref:Uncharacterized protein n=1 Tax=Caenorhabditis japonica TaxID=281687 RepID=A0A8R1DH02_CAEJA
MRVPGRCMQGDYDCGLGQCVPISQFRDGKPDCLDGSDEWCFIGQVSCGPVYCADYKDALPCIVYPKCDGSSKQLPWCTASKENVCKDKTSFPCKGYGECVLWDWLLDGKKDCIDGSDEDEDYVMPLEHAYRCSRNQTGLYLPKPIPPPPEDHPSLYVEGCSMCTNNLKTSTSSPSSKTVGEHTTPKYPFISSSSSENPFGNTQPPLSNFPLFPSEESKNGEFFPPGVEISRVTHGQLPETSHPNEPIGDFFPTPSTQSTPTQIPTQSFTFRGVTIPSSISQTHLPKAPLIFPMRPDLPPITAPSPLNNWPIPIVTRAPESHYHSTLPPITYPNVQEVPEKIIPIKPAIIISRPVTAIRPNYPSDYEPGVIPPDGVQVVPSAITNSPMEFFTTPQSVGFSQHVRPVDGKHGSTEYGIVENYGIQKPVGETLIPLVPPHVIPYLPTRRPWTIPSYFTTHETPSYPLNPSHVTSYPPITDQRTLPTLIPESEVEKYAQTKVQPSWITDRPDVDFITHGNRKTTIPEGFIEEYTHSPPLSPDNNQTPQTESFTGHPLPETTTLRHTKTTSRSRSKIIHVGPNGVVEELDSSESENEEEENNVEETDDTEGVISTNPSTGNVIHIGPTTKTTHSIESTSTFAPSSSITTTETTTTTTATTEVIVSTEESEESEETTPSIENSKIESCLKKMSGSNKNSVICDCPNGQMKNEASGKCEGLILGNLYTSCIRSNTDGSALIATVRCEDCTVQDINRVLSRRSFEDPGSLNVSVEGAYLFCLVNQVLNFNFFQLLEASCALTLTTITATCTPTARSTKKVFDIFVGVNKELLTLRMDLAGIVKGFQKSQSELTN